MTREELKRKIWMEAFHEWHKVPGVDFHPSGKYAIEYADRALKVFEEKFLESTEKPLTSNMKWMCTTFANYCRSEAEKPHYTPKPFGDLYENFIKGL